VGGVVCDVVEVGPRCRIQRIFDKRTKSAAEPDLNTSKLWEKKQSKAVAVEKGESKPDQTTPE